jgi:hypothetical protein
MPQCRIPKPKIFNCKIKVNVTLEGYNFWLSLDLTKILHIDFCNFISIVAPLQHEVTKIKWANKTAVSFETHILCYK